MSATFDPFACSPEPQNVSPEPEASSSAKGISCNTTNPESTSKITDELLVQPPKLVQTTRNKLSDQIQIRPDDNIIDLTSEPRRISRNSSDDSTTTVPNGLFENIHNNNRQRNDNSRSLDPNIIQRSRENSLQGRNSSSSNSPSHSLDSQLLFRSLQQNQIDPNTIRQINHILQPNMNQPQMYNTGKYLFPVVSAQTH